MPREYTPAAMAWVSVISMAMGVIMAVIAVGIFSGRLEARVSTLENAQAQSIQRGEWSQFEKDVRARLDRIEDKLDRHMVSPRR